MIVLVAVSSGGGSASVRSFESILQDDQYLLYSPPPVVAQTLDVLRQLGVDRVRLTIIWSAIAPQPTSHVRPAGFDASDPAAYAPASWVPYDRVVQLAAARGIGIDFDVTAPGPRWAMGAGAPDAKASTHYRPDPAEFGLFVKALGRRYDGTYRAANTPASPSRLPRVSFWTVWNEPNQPGWLSPQWQSTASGWQMVSPRLYRGLVDAAVRALQASGHTASRDRVLIGELAPEGLEQPQVQNPITPLPFLRQLYCLDASYHPLRGAAATAAGCPDGGDAQAFVSAHPGLFEISAFAHHPYAFFLPPAASMSDPNFAPLSDLTRLQRALDQTLAAYGLERKLDLYLTEYGYETYPPNPYRGVPPATQARYLDQATYMAWRDPRVRALSQFLLYDSPPNHRYPPGSVRYWSTFQTGLRFIDGRAKPSFYTYRLPIWISRPSAPTGQSFPVWGMLRAAQNGSQQQATIEWRSGQGPYRTLAQVRVSDPSGFFAAEPTLPGTGFVRILWRAPGGQLITSREVAVRAT